MSKSSSPINKFKNILTGLKNAVKKANIQNANVTIQANKFKRALKSIKKASGV